MKKFLFGALTLFFSIAIISCDKSDEPEMPETPDVETPGDTEEPAEPEPEELKGLDLSADEMANCYVVQEPGVYRFKADNQFNLGVGLPVPPEIEPVSGKLVWQTEAGLIKEVEFAEDAEGQPYIIFEVEKAEGNALIAALDSENEIVWTWHIWMPVQEINSVPTDTGYDVMTMNLGALNNTPGDVASYGMLYQWGRKEPFPAAPTLTGTTTTVSAPLFDDKGNPVTIENSSWSSVTQNTIAYSIAHPTVVLSNYAQYASSRDWLKASDSDDMLWGHDNAKTCYDPSPAGWRVAPADAFANLTTTGGYAWTFDDFNVADINGDGVVDLNDYNYGWHFKVSERESLYFPAAARFDGSYAMLMGSVSGIWGNYWSNAPYEKMTGGAVCGLAFQVKDQSGNEMITMSPSAGSSRADAYSVRCVRTSK